MGAVNAYVLPGTRPALVDTGAATPSALAALHVGLEEIGLGIADLAVVAVTHGHLDHLGLAAQVQAASGARVVGHPRAVAALADFPAHWRARLDLLDRAAQAADAPPEVRSAALAAERGLESLGESVPENHLSGLPDGARLPLGDSEWTAVHTPGHSGDHIALLHGPSGSAFTGDLLLRHLQTVPYLEPARRGTRPNVMAELIASWRRLGRLPLGIAWPGHGGPIRAHRILVARRLVAARSRLQVARAELAGGAETVWDLAAALGLSSEPSELPAVLGETVALISWLVDRGLASREESGGVIRYRLTERRRAAG
ncbi:MAG: MBL fold metallo-hydrolase [Anaerolineae bacterium]